MYFSYFALDGHLPAKDQLAGFAPAPSANYFHRQGPWARGAPSPNKRRGRRALPRPRVGTKQKWLFGTKGRRYTRPSEAAVAMNRVARGAGGRKGHIPQAQTIP